MKMTQEEKAKRYDEVVKEIKGFFEGKQKMPNDVDKTLELLFPELKENEDERIREELIGFLRNIPNSNYTCEEMALWLEKQGENHDDKYNITGIKSKHAEGKLGEMIKEIKSTDKVEPKFHEGEWLCENEPNNYARFIQILETVNVQGKKRYRISRDIHNDEDIVEFDFVEKYYHKFDIKDAKDGDILYTPKGLGVEGIFLVSGWQQIEGTGKTLCSYIGYRVDDDEIVEGGLGAIWWKGVVDPFYPATKEQRDKFEKAMTDAGYTFDFEREELKNIEL